jgi:hypothetical protein
VDCSGDVTARVSLAIAFAATQLAHAAWAGDTRPSDATLVLVGAAMAPPTYLLGVTWHESSHALATLLVGADIDELHVFPPGIDPSVHRFRFGWTYVHGLHTRAQRAAFFIAPKLTDLALLGGFAALAFGHAWPHNSYGELALTVVATGAWVDFAKDVVLLSPVNDVSQFERAACFTGWRRVIARAVYAAADVGLAFVVFHGYQRLFAQPTTSAALPRTVIVPIITAPL